MIGLGTRVLTTAVYVLFSSVPIRFPCLLALFDESLCTFVAGHERCTHFIGGRDRRANDVGKGHGKGSSLGKRGRRDERVRALSPMLIPAVSLADGPSRPEWFFVRTIK